MLAGVPSWHPGQVPWAHSPNGPGLITLAWRPTTATSSCCSSWLAHDVVVLVDIGHAYPATERPLCLVCMGGCRIAFFGHMWASDVAELAGADRHLPAAALQLSLLTRLRWPLLWYWTTTGIVFCADYGLQCGCYHGRLLDSILPFHI